MRISAFACCACAFALIVVACRPASPPTLAGGPAAATMTTTAATATAATSPSASGADFDPYTALGSAAAGCAAAQDCVVVAMPSGACFAVVGKIIDAAFDAKYAAWVAARAMPPGTASTVTHVAAVEMTARCGPDFGGVRCESGRCALTSADCSYGGTTRSRCEAQGGTWGGCVNGRGRTPGCMLPTKDAGKPCSDKKQCEGACVDGKCWHLSAYKGCGYMVDGQSMCVE